MLIELGRVRSKDSERAKELNYARYEEAEDFTPVDGLYGRTSCYAKYWRRPGNKKPIACYIS